MLDVNDKEPADVEKVLEVVKAAKLITEVVTTAGVDNKLSIEYAAFMIREKAWSIVGKDVCLAVKDFFVTGKILREINSTLIALVPKMQTPQKVSDFRPIACCNVLYKCISKINTDRINGCLDKLVSKNQSAFIPNRHIQDNIMLAQEFFKGYDRKIGPKRVALKVDIQKSYDTVNWQFLKDILRGFGFHDRMVEWIMNVSPLLHFLSVLMERVVAISKVLKESIEEFGEVVGMMPNYNKSTIIFGCLNDEERKEILDIMPFK
nr:hypothetical protein [Tanacetum cinerariifolium]